jgi:pimeloyl-ACP methyl ester carboxylesterase
LAKELYLFSGLGADERVYQKIDFTGYKPVFIQWEIPEGIEPIEDYAKKLIKQIKTENPILIGLSFGGIIAIEVAKQIETEKVILIASTKTRNELPFYYKWARHIRLHKFIPIALLKSSNFMTNWFFGTSSDSDKKLLKAILKDTNAIFLKWAIERIVKWRSVIELKNIQHIHGTSDRIFPYRFICCDFDIIEGGHFMTINKAEEVTKTLRAILESKKV